ncbi:MAG: 2-C-methyl-D-erythritol 4-phosphate cytidylyltransferase [Magnetococcales bacterium]|nr:2-C-methyl-D-erythritol 4-phosphate cytidylyltransferase [Magnetococcales bacterium]
MEPHSPDDTQSSLSAQGSDPGQPCVMLVVAAGKGQRFGAPLPKQYCTLGGKPLLLHTLQHLHDHPAVNAILPIISREDVHFGTLSGDLAAMPKVLAPVFGGKKRQDSVYQGLKSLKLPPEAWVGIHDAARPLVSLALLDRLLAARSLADALIPALPPSDTVKLTDGSEVVHSTLDRARIRLVQTPQLFRFGLILEAHAHARQCNFQGTDDASLVELMETPVHCIPGDPWNLKITHPQDLGLAELLLQGAL